MKLYLIVYVKDKKYQFIKYFDNVYEMDNFKRKIKWCKNMFIVEDSRDIVYN